jgi:hypothetical protein
MRRLQYAMNPLPSTTTALAKNFLLCPRTLWTNRVVAYNNTIQSGRSQLVRYSFIMPPAAVGPVTITATVKYRRFDQHFMGFGMGKHYEQPVVDMVSQIRTIQAGENKPVLPDPAENKEWMRWNNFGIALLDAQQYAASAHAFERVAKLRPDYVDAYTNVAIAQIQWQRFDHGIAFIGFKSGT